MMNIRKPTVAKGIFFVAVILGGAWYLSGLIAESLAWRLPLAIVLVSIEYIFVLAVIIIFEQLAKYAGRIEDERES